MLLCAACEKEIEFTGEDSEPVLVVNGLQYVGETPRLMVHRSRFIMDGSTDLRVKGLEAKLFVNDEFVENLSIADSTMGDTYVLNDYSSFSSYSGGDYQSFSYNYCTGNYVFRTGDKVRFEVSGDEFDKVTAEIVMPEMPSLLSFDTLKVERICETSYEDCPDCYPDLDENGNHCRFLYDYEWDDDDSTEFVYDTVYPGDYLYADIYFDMKMSDPLGINYYNLMNRDNMEQFCSSNPAFLMKSNLFEGIDLDMIISDMGSGNLYFSSRFGNLFSDQCFDGKEYDIQFVCYNASYNDELDPDNHNWSIDLYQVDENYYKYEETLSNVGDSDMSQVLGLFMEPAQIYSNVKGGIGIVGAVSAPARASVAIDDAE